MKTENDKKLFLDNLKKIPIIQVACERSTVSRASIYRWKNEDKEFAKNMEAAMAEGEALINDMGEGQLISLIREKNFPALRFWLIHRNPKFREKIEVTAKIEKREELTPEQEDVVREALRLASLDKKDE
jgi:predicted DNA binding protein